MDILYRADYKNECGRLVFIRYRVRFSVKLPDILSESLCGVPYSVEMKLGSAVRTGLEALNRMVIVI